MPKRVQLKRTRGYKRPEGCVNVARPTCWGNPFKVGEMHARGLGPMSLEQCLYDFELTMSSALLARARVELRGKDLACWCPLDKPCHADIWLRLVND